MANHTTMWIHGLTALITLAVPALSQTPPRLPVKAPSELEEAVRRRADEFYQLQMDGKFRAAERYVCEASQEAYYTSEKRKWLSKEVARIEFGPGYSTAKVWMRLGSEAMMPPAGRVTLKSMISSEWRLEDGQWCYVIPEPGAARDTPFGKMSSAKPDDPSKTAEPANIPRVEGGFVMKAVSVSKPELRVKGYEASSDQVEFTNGLTGAVELQLTAPDLPGLDVKLSETKLKGKQKALLTVNYKPATTTAKATSEVIVNVVPTGQVFKLKLFFDVQPGLVQQPAPAEGGPAAAGSGRRPSPKKK